VTGQVELDVEDIRESIEFCYSGGHVWRSRSGDELVSWCSTRLYSWAVVRLDWDALGPGIGAEGATT
jgi:hypothetical protein